MYHWSVLVQPAIHTLSLLAAVRTHNELPSRVLAPALASLRVLDATRSLTTALALVAPEESPVIGVLSHFRRSRGSAGVRFACSVGRAVVLVVLVVDFEDGEGLGFVGAGVVAALGGLDGVAGLCDGAAWRGWVGAFGVRGGGGEGCGCEAEGQGEGEEVGEHFGGLCYEDFVYGFD